MFGPQIEYVEESRPSDLERARYVLQLWAEEEDTSRYPEDLAFFLEQAGFTSAAEIVKAFPQFSYLVFPQLFRVKFSIFSYKGMKVLKILHINLPWTEVALITTSHTSTDVMVKAVESIHIENQIIITMFAGLNYS